MMSSDSELTKGISMIPITAPATSAIWFWTSIRYWPIPSSGPPTISAPRPLKNSRKAGPTVRAAKKP
jgi:hypothetical protein